MKWNEKLILSFSFILLKFVFLCILKERPEFIHDMELIVLEVVSKKKKDLKWP